MLFRFALFLSTLMFVLPQQLPAQGIFDAFGFPKSVVATGHTEVLGSVHVALRQGSVSADTLVIDVSPLQITNANAGDIRITTSGNITTGAATIEAEDGRVRIPVNAGGNNGTLRVDGIRVSIAGTNSSSVTARVSWWTNQNIFSNTRSVIVVDKVQSGLAVDAMTDVFRVFNNIVYDNTAAIALREGYGAAFTNSSDFGQNTPTRIRIRATDFPSGLVMHFPASVTANESAATLSTVEGSAVDLPRGDGTTDVTYNFNSAANSADLLESFNIAFTVTTQGTVSTLQPTIELSLAPIGAAVPTTALPAANIPRFAQEDLLVLEGSSRIITKTIYWTGIDSSRDNRLSILNPTSRVTNIVLSAFDAAGKLLSGTNVNNSIKQSLAANQSSDQLLTEIFGTGASNIATVRVQSTNAADIVAIGTVSGDGISEFAPVVDRVVTNFVVPRLDEGGVLYIFNPGSATASGTLTLKARDGSVGSTNNVTVGSMQTISVPFSSSSSGEIVGSFSAAVIASESFGSSTTLNIVSAQVAVGIESLYVPFFTTGGGYETDLSLVNSSDQTVTLTGQLVDNQGAPILSRQITLVPGDQLLTTIRELFQVQSVSSGYIRIRVPELYKGPWAYYPPINGYARIRYSQSASTAMSLSGYPQSESSIPASGTSPGQFQGLAFVNPNASVVTVNLQALTTAGAVLGTATFNLAPGQISSKLTSELFSIAIPERSVIRVTSSDQIVTTSITGSLNGTELRSTPGLR